jgi:hypothetical protein
MAPTRKAFLPIRIRPIASVLDQTLANLVNEVPVPEEDKLAINKAVVSHPLRVATHDGDCAFSLINEVGINRPFGQFAKGFVGCG